MDNPKEHFQTLFVDAKEYLQNKAELWKLKAVDKTSGAVSSIVEKLIVFVMLFFFFIFFNIALALLIGYWLGNSFYGFFILAAFYGIVGLIVHIARDKLIRRPITTMIIQKFIK